MAASTMAFIEPLTGPAEDVPLFKKRAPRSSMRKRAATPPPADDSDSDYSTADEADTSGQTRVKRRKTNAGNGMVTAGSTAMQEITHHGLEQTGTFQGDRSRVLNNENDATRTSNWVESDAHALDAKSLLGSTRTKSANSTSISAPPNSESDGSYKGQAGYTNFIQKTADQEAKSKIGPTKAAPTNVRVTNYTDFAPDVCKDYKQTGFCGFGDSCKFLHAREDYKQGWQLDSEWDKFAKGKKEVQGKTMSSRNGTAGGANGDDEEGYTKEEVEMLEKIPFACVICKEEYKNPIVTRCGHYFCERCALDRFRKTPTCAACAAGTAGVFNGAKGLKRLLENKKVREEKKRDSEEKKKAEEAEAKLR